MLRLTRIIALLTAWVLASRHTSATALPAAAPSVPLCPGLTIVTAVSHRDGDYESIKTVEP
jgi:hypothetical protein